MVMSWTTCLKNIHTKPIAIVWFSMLLLFHNCPFSVWNILSHLQLALSINTTKCLYKVATSISFAERMNWRDHGSIAMLDADNLLFHTCNAIMRINGNKMERYILDFIRNTF